MRNMDELHLKATGYSPSASSEAYTGVMPGSTTSSTVVIWEASATPPSA